MRRNWFETESARLPFLQLGDDLEQKALYPLSCIIEHESKWVLELDLPLVEKKDIKVFFDAEGFLTVEAKLKEVFEDYKGNQRCKFEYFKRSMSLPKNVDEKKITAQFKDGRLSITIPKLFQGSQIKVD